MYRIILLIHNIVATFKRSFSKLKLLKSYLRSAMLQNILNNLALISIKRNVERTFDIYYKRIINEFTKK